MWIIGGVPVYSFFLGGYDLEMLRIQDILTLRGSEFYDKKLGWGAKASAYQQEIARVADQGKIPVLIELGIDLELPANSVVVDHHGNRSGEEASLIQVLNLLGLIPSRWDQIIAANDSGYIPAMKALGADEFHIRAVRSADRRAQGVTEEMEKLAQQAINCKTTFPDGTVMVHLPHRKSSAVTDRLFQSWPNGKENLLVVCCPSCNLEDWTPEIHYFGPGDRCKAIQERFAPDSWGGGSGFGDPNKNAFVGFKTNDVDRAYLFVSTY